MQRSDAQVPRRPLGRTGEEVSIIGLGGFHIGKPELPEEDSVRLIRAAIDAGITFMDNAWDYHHGESERRMGRALRDGYRDRVFLMTKVDGRDRRSARQQLDESLERLQTDHLDLLQFHEVIRGTDPERVFAEGGALEAAIEAKDEGLVRYIGFTGHKHPDIHNGMLDLAERYNFHFDTVQMPLNLLDAHFESFERKVLPRLVGGGFGVLGMKPICSGRLLDSGIVKATDCLRYALSLPTDVVITGCESMEVLSQALTVARNFRPLSEDERSHLLSDTSELAADGAVESYKTGDEHDSTKKHPEWLGPSTEKVRR